MTTTPSLTRGAIPYKPRSVAWYDSVTGEIAHESKSDIIRIQPYADIADVLRSVSSRVLYILPDENGHVPGRDWYKGATKIGCTVDRYLAKVHAATVSRGEKSIDIFPVSQYFDSTPNVHECKKTWVLLNGLLRGSFGEHVTLMGTAGATGLHLLRLSLPKGQKYEVLPSDIQETLLHNFGQGRIESFYSGKDIINDCYEVDGTWMYASCLRNLPTGTPTRDTINELDNKGYTPGFYRVVATVPQEWQHIGLLPAFDEQAAKRHADTKSMYPNVPGATFESWATHGEVRLAIEHKWDVQICERILWKERSSDPLRLWAERLIRLRERCEAASEPQHEMLRQAFRSIMLKGIGSFYRHDVYKDGYAPLSEIENVTGQWELEDDETVHVVETPELSKMQLQTLQPHWPATIWGQARVRLAKAALCLPYESLIALRTDGIWTLRDIRQDDNPMWTYTGKPGQWRVKYEHHTPVEWPRNNKAVVHLLNTVKGTGRVA